MTQAKTVTSKSSKLLWGDVSSPCLSKHFWSQMDSADMKLPASLNPLKASSR